MSKVIYFSVDLHGHVNPTLGLMKKLVEKGEEVIYYSSDEFRDKIEETGAAFRSYQGLVGFGTYDGDGMDTFILTADFILGRSQIIVKHFMDEIKEIQPDYIIHDAFCYWGREFAANLNIPGISVFDSFAYIDEMADMDPDYFMENVLRAGENPMYKKYKDSTNMYRKLLNKLSKVISLKYDLKEINIINDVFCSNEKLNILFTSKAFQLYSEAFDDRYWFSGYSIYPRKELADFPFERLDGRALIYIAFGTIFNNVSGIYKNCFKAFENTNYQVVLSIGNKLTMEELGDIPDNFIVRHYVPQLEILKRADAFITHGGANSIHEGLCFNVPLVVVPQSFDQFMGAIAVENAGAGIYIRNREASAQELEEAVQNILTNKCYYENCKKIKESFESTGGLEQTVAEIFKFVGKHRSELEVSTYHTGLRG